MWGFQSSKGFNFPTPLTCIYCTMWSTLAVYDGATFIVLSGETIRLILCLITVTTVGIT